MNTLHDLQEKGIHVRTTDGMINTRALGKFAPIVIGLLSGLESAFLDSFLVVKQSPLQHSHVLALLNSRSFVLRFDSWRI